MKRLVTVFTMLFVALALNLSSGQALAGKKGKGKKVAKLTTLQGEVVKLTGKKGKLLGIKLKGDDGKVYRVYMNKMGRMMVRKLAGKKAEVSAVRTRKGTRKRPVLWLNVRKFKAVAEAPEDAPEDAPEEDTIGD